jgi:uncharacterized protein involved in exopolysaccharide biosynthesis
LNKPITNNGNLNLKNLIDFLNKNSVYSLKYSFYIILLFSVYFFLKTPTYSSKLTFYTNYKNTNQSSLLSPFLGDIAGLDDTGLNFSVSEHLASDRFLEGIVEKKYVINEKEISLVEHWGGHYNNYFTINPLSLINTVNRNIMFAKNLSVEEKKLSFAKEVVSSKIFHSENRRSGLNTITVVVKKYPHLSKQINEQVYLAILDYTNKINNIKANEKIIFIQARLMEVQANLHNSEKKMVEFLDKNKNFETSPILVFEKNKLQREINAFNQVYLSLLDQDQLTKIDAEDKTNSIFILDSPSYENYKYGNSFIKSIVVIFFGSIAIIISMRIYFFRKELFL